MTNDPQINYAPSPAPPVHRETSGLTIFESQEDGVMAGHVYSAYKDQETGPLPGGTVRFQHGPVPQNGVNGLTNEALLAILLHRTRIINDKFPCKENVSAIQHLEDALAHFEARTFRRQLRGVEGKNLL